MNAITVDRTGWVVVALWLMACGALAGASPPSGSGERAEARPTPREASLASAERTLDERVQDLRRLLRDQEWRQALTESAALMTRYAERPEVRGLRSQALLRAGRPGAAAALLSASTTERMSPRGAIVQARLDVASGRGEGVAARLMQATQRAPGDPEVLYWAGELSADRDQAIGWLSRYLEVGSDEPADRRRAVEGALRVLREAERRQVATWQVQSRPERVDLQLRPIWSRSIEGYVLQARLSSGRRKTPLLFDTGSSGLFVLERAVRKLDFEPLAEREVQGGGGDGRHRSVSGTTSALRLGELQWRRPLVKTVPGELDPTGRFHGLLGLQPFHGYRVRVDFPKGRLELRQVSESESDADADAAEAEAEAEAEGDAGARYWWFSGQLVVEATVNGDEPTLLVLDTGAVRTTLSLELAEHLERLRIAGDARLRGFGGVVQGRMIRGAEVRFGAARTSGDLPAIGLQAAGRLGGVEIGGLLGLDALAEGVLEFDTVAQRVSWVASKE